MQEGFLDEKSFAFAKPISFAACCGERLVLPAVMRRNGGWVYGLAISILLLI